MVMRYATAGSILAYQRWISPHKGYCCAYRRLTGARSCSEYARQTVLAHGVVTLARALPRQFARCRRAYATLLAMTAAAEGGEQVSDKRPARGRRADSDHYCWLDGLGTGLECLALPCDS
jgi:putative component of membrane protein insertase Oxa1/YidC/SpoIIIJ protein YidD